MTQFFNVADLKDPSDPQRRSYREVNRDRKHRYAVGQLVELDNGCRLFIAKQTRDCDETPLYSVAVNLDSDDEIELMKWHHGYGEESLKAV
ncbi:MAG: hypothetical protein ACN2B6_00050 [Rickettsiales bacterium]